MKGIQKITRIITFYNYVILVAKKPYHCNKVKVDFLLLET